MNNNLKTIFIVPSLLLFLVSAQAATEYSPRKLAVGNISDDIYDTYDFITTRPDLLTRVDKGEILVYPDELVKDISSLVNMLNDNPERNFNNRLGFVYNMRAVAFGLHLKNEYSRLFSSSPYHDSSLSYSDIDLDGITAEANEAMSTMNHSGSNYTGVENLDYGISFALPLNNMYLGVSYQKIGDDTVSLSSENYERYHNNYGSSIISSKTNYSINNQSKDSLSQDIFILNFGINKTPVSSGSNIISPKEPFFLLQTKFIIQSERLVQKNKKRTVYDQDPGIQISSTKMNKTIQEDSGSKPYMEWDKTTEQYILQTEPRFTFKANPDLKYNIQAKFGIGFSGSYTNQEKTIDSDVEYATDPLAKFQDTRSSYDERISTYKGDVSYLMYGLRIEQVFKPKYFIVGIALDATIEHNTLSQSGRQTHVKKVKYETSTNYTCQSPAFSGIPEQYILTQYPDTKVSVETKEITATISMPAGFEFDVLSWLKMRIGYTFTLTSSAVRTTTITTNGGQTTTTTSFEDPSTPTQITYSGTGYSETTDVDYSTSYAYTSILSSGFEIILSPKTVMNLSGQYNITGQNGIFLAETKFKF
ncbi:MAG: hypothetical protein PHF84_00490 [bacterium]|nr:hypothetical protein [bacterium]